MLVDLGTDLAAAVGYMSRLKAPVTVIGTSKGTERLAQGLAKGARPDKVVLSSGFQPGIGPGDSVQAILARRQAAAGLGYPPPRGSLPLDAPGRGRAVQDLGRFEGRGRVAQRRRDDQANPCRYSAHHGFAGLDAAFVDRVMAFVAK